MTDAEHNKGVTGVVAEQFGIFGAPSFAVGEELFWGKDRLADALN